MVIKVEEISLNKAEIRVNGELKYLVESETVKNKSLLNQKTKYISKLITKDGNTNYTIVNDSGNGKGCIIYDECNSVCGKDLNWKIRDCEYKLQAYDKNVGKTENTIIHKDGVQIAEILRGLAVEYYLDHYYIFLLDEYSELEPIISLYTAFKEYIAVHSGTGLGKEMMGAYKKVYVSYSWRPGENKYYDKNWIKNNFPKEDVDWVYADIEGKREKVKKDLKEYAKKLIFFILTGWIILFIITTIVYFNTQV